MHVDIYVYSIVYMWFIC